MTRRNTSVRFTEDEYELIDAMAAALTSTRGTPTSRADVFRAALKRMNPPDTLGPEFSRWRRAYDIVFHRHSTPDGDS